MKSYTLREIDEALWKRVRLRAVEEGVSVRELIFRALREYLGRGVGHD